MKKTTLLTFSALALFFTACNNTPKGEEAQVAEEQTAAATAGITYNLNLDSSAVTWVGASPVKQHTGTFKLSQGSLSVADNNITGGSFTIDIASINDSDLQGEYKTKLETHLKSADFFDAEKFPTAKFEITGVQATSEGGNTHNISGNLTLKDVTKNITFPAKVTLTDTEVMASANFNIDRSQWNMSYGADNSLGDKMINAEVNLTVNLKATK